MMTTEAISLAAIVGRDWTHGTYYDLAEKSMDWQWSNLIWPMIESSDFDSVVEIAAGRGRNTQKLTAVSNHVIATDINRENVEALETRFRSEPKVTILQNSGADLRAIPGASASMVYSFDAMVHFDSDIIRSYVREIRRIMKPGGRGFCHYSDFSDNPTGTYRDHPGWRNFMSRELFEHWLTKAGFRVLQSRFVHAVTNFTDDRSQADNMTFFELPGDAEPGGDFLSFEERCGELSLELTALEQRRADCERQRDETRQTLDAKSAEADELHRKVGVLTRELASERDTRARAQNDAAELATQVRLVYKSSSWRLTAPVRWLKRRLS